LSHFTDEQGEGERRSEKEKMKREKEKLSVTLSVLHCFLLPPSSLSAPRKEFDTEFVFIGEHPKTIPQKNQSGQEC
jgi:hypothetical protein